jgi:Histidine kinase-, DNA gyrase B-, and HSP90-like ATPase
VSSAHTRTTSQTRSVDANPEKRFFIAMLVRDIELVPAIVDLVDNSVDSARDLWANTEGRKPRLEIEIVATSDQFTITDNCGGIDADLAKKYAFRFGRPIEHEGIDDSIGQFGIGMKRSLFKLGGHFVVDSSTSSSCFVLEVDVDDWARKTDTNWTFEFSSVNYRRNTTSRPHGTSVVVDQLHPSVRADLGLASTINRIRDEVQNRHASILREGLRITVNDKSLVGHAPMLLSSERIKPISSEFQLNFEEGDVNVYLYAGIAQAKERDGDRDDGDAESFTDASEAGWYIYCNDRLVIAADKSDLTGWSRPVAAAYHPQYRDFRGYIFLYSNESSLLPWDTTKTSLDRDSKVFRAVQQHMFTALQQVQLVLNRVKKERTEGVTDRPISLALASAERVELDALDASDTFQAPTPEPTPRRRGPSKNVQVQFPIARSVIERIQEYFGVKSARQAAQLAIKQFVETELDDHG